MIAIDPVFNEPSLRPLAADKQIANNRIAGAIGVLTRMPEFGLGSSLRISNDFYLLELATHYTINDWINDPLVPKDQLRFFLSLAAKCPFLRSTDGAAIERIEDTEVVCYGQHHPCFVASYALDAPLVSFDNDVWSEPDLPVIMTRLGGDAELSEDSGTLVNFSKPSDFTYHAPWFTRRNAVSDSEELWTRRAELFPHLTFCPTIESQLNQQNTILSQIIDRLQSMEKVAASGRPFDKDSFDFQCHATSATTFQQFGAAYEFTTPDDLLKRCGWHFYLPDGRRIYFSSDYTIGHIGGHLPTVKYH